MVSHTESWDSLLPTASNVEALLSRQWPTIHWTVTGEEGESEPSVLNVQAVFQNRTAKAKLHRFQDSRPEARWGGWVTVGFAVLRRFSEHVPVDVSLDR